MNVTGVQTCALPISRLERARKVCMEMTTADSGTFVYANPRTIHWGAGSLAPRLLAELNQRGLSRAFVVSTRSVAANPSLGGHLRQLLGDRYVDRKSTRL